MQASVIIPVYNESENIMEVIKKIGKGYEIIVVDDGSEKNICHIVKSRVKCVRLGRNMGKGYACRVGAIRASCKKIVFIDGDSQLDAGQIPEFVSALDKADIALGFRRKKDLPFQRMISNTFAVLMIFLSTSRYYKDVLCGFRAIKKDKFIQLDLRRNRYEFESEFMVKASKKGLSYREIPVRVEYKRRGMRIKDSLKVVFYQFTEFVKSF